MPPTSIQICGFFLDIGSGKDLTGRLPLDRCACLHLALRRTATEAADLDGAAGGVWENCLAGAAAKGHPSSKGHPGASFKYHSLCADPLLNPPTVPSFIPTAAVAQTVVYLLSESTSWGEAAEKNGGRQTEYAPLKRVATTAH